MTASITLDLPVSVLRGVSLRAGFACGAANLILPLARAARKADALAGLLLVFSLVAFIAQNCGDQELACGTRFTIKIVVFVKAGGTLEAFCKARGILYKATWTGKAAVA